MISEIARKLLRLADAIEPDGGATLAQRLLEVLPAHMRAEAGEIILALEGTTRRLPMIAPSESLAADDALDHVLSHDRVLRFDDIPDATRFPQTRALLLKRGLRSLLMLPLTTAKDPRAIAVLASSHPCAFAGIPSGTTEPLRAMAGIALSASLRLTHLHEQIDLMQTEKRALEPTNESSESDVEQAEDATPDTEPGASSGSRRGRRFRFHSRKD
ncbi:MAG: GAF domain-containing protein [Vicinamibacteria bacterium]|nr:GAF domain-containing protein [Vicinamibacteria bacterium]